MKKKSDLNYLSVEDIERNPQNPRLVFDAKKMNELQESINEVGILVPLIVYYDDEVNKYILLDGERRLRCAKALGLKEVPANIIAKPTKVQNILQMFNIHNVRIEWGPMEVAWKLKTIMEETEIDKESELARMTSLKNTEIRKCRTLLSFDRKYQELVHDGEARGGIKQDFLVELKPVLNWLEKELPDINQNELLESLIKKHKTKVIDNYVRGFRDLRKVVRSGLKNDRVGQIFKSLIEKPKYNIEDALEASVKQKMDIAEVENRANRLLNLLQKLNLKKGDEENKDLLKVLEKLQSSIERILKNEK